MVKHASDVEYDKRREAVVDALLREGNIKEARSTAARIRGRKERERVEAKIDVVEETP